MRNSIPRHHLRFEQLEDRNLLAGLVHVDFDPSTGHLSIIGDEFDNAIRVEFNLLGSGLTSVVVLDDDGTTTLIDDGFPSTLLAYEIDPTLVDIWVDLGAGDDSAVLENAVGGAVRAANELHINGNDGEDLLAVLGAPGAPLEVGQLAVDGAADDDIVNITDVVIEGALEIQTGGADDFVFFYFSRTGTLTIETDDGVDFVDIFSSQVIGDLDSNLGSLAAQDPPFDADARIDTGTGDSPAGSDTIFVTDSTFRGDLDISTGRGPDIVIIDPTIIRRNLTVTTGADDDTVVLSEVMVARVAMLNTGGGIDEVTVTDSVFLALNASLGAGNDTFIMSGSTVIRYGRVRTQVGDDTVDLDNNDFQGRLLIDMGVLDGGLDALSATDNMFADMIARGLCASLLVDTGNTGSFTFMTEVC